MSDPSDFNRGSVWQVRLDPVEGSEQGGTRPVVVISSDVLNQALPLLTVAVMTTRKTERVFPTEVLVQPPEGGLTRTSKVLLYQVRTVARSRLTEFLGHLAPETMLDVDAALRRALAL